MRREAGENWRFIALKFWWPGQFPHGRKIEFPIAWRINVERARNMPKEPSPEEKASATMAATALKNARTDDGAVEIRAGDSAAVWIESAIADKLIDLLDRVSNGDMVGFVPANSMVTSHEAASILNVSHEFFLKLLEDGEIKHLPPGYLHRVCLVGLMSYLERRTIERSAVLDELARLGQECDAT